MDHESRNANAFDDEIEAFIREARANNDEEDIEALLAELNQIDISGDTATPLNENTSPEHNNIGLPVQDEVSPTNAINDPNEVAKSSIPKGSVLDQVVPLDPKNVQIGATSGSIETGDPAPSIPKGYAIFADGIYSTHSDETVAPAFICSPMRVEAMVANLDGTEHARLVNVRSNDGKWHDVLIKNSELYGPPAKVVGRLADLGLELVPHKESKDCLVYLLKVWKPVKRLQAITRLGWVDDGFNAFATGSSVIGRNDVLQNAPSAGVARGLLMKGTAETWRREIGKKCAGNPLMVLAASLAFSAPILAPLGLGGGGLHFRGASSSGKTTLLALAASVWGSRALVTQWRATTNGLEAISATLNDMLLPLDEIAEISAQDLHKAIYMLANGTGKARMTKDAVLAEQARWRLALISSGEISVEQKLREGRRDAMAGHEVRIIDVEADSRAYGAFDDLHGASSAAIFADQIQMALRQHHGSVGPEFVRKLIDARTTTNVVALEDQVRSLMTTLLNKLPSAADGQISRVAHRFAVIGVAGELATKFGLTGWNANEAVFAAEQAFSDWYERRYGSKREVVDQYIKPLQQFVAANLQTLRKVNDDSALSSSNVGWRDESRIYLPRETWQRLFPGVHGTQAAKALLDMQMLIPGEEDRLTRKAPRPIGLKPRPRLYTVRIDAVMAYKGE